MKFEEMINYNYKPQNIHIHCLINEAAANLTVNLLHSINFKASLTCNSYEIEDFIQCCDALSINLGGLNQDKIEFLQSFKFNNLIWGIDPVLVNLSKFRLNLFYKLLEYKPKLVRCNLKEFESICSLFFKQKNLSFKKKLINLSIQLNTIIIVTGSIDYLCYHNQCFSIESGHWYQQYITGMGCAISAVLVAQYSSNQSFRALVQFYCALSNLAQKAGDSTKSPQAFLIEYLDMCFVQFRENSTIILKNLKILSNE